MYRYRNARGRGYRGGGDRGGGDRGGYEGKEQVARTTARAPAEEVYAFEQLGASGWCGNVVPLDAAHAAMRIETLQFFSTPLMPRATPHGPCDAAFPLQWASSEACAAARAAVAAALPTPSPPVYTGSAGGGAGGGAGGSGGRAGFAAAQAAYAAAARDVATRAVARNDVAFTDLNEPAFRAIRTALLDEPRQWWYADITSEDIVLQATRVAMVLTRWAYGADGALCVGLLDTYTAAANDFCTQRRRLLSVRPTDAAPYTWRSPRGASVWGVLFAYAAFLQVRIDADADGLVALGDAVRAGDALALKRQRHMIKRGLVCVGTGTDKDKDTDKDTGTDTGKETAKPGRQWWWGELFSHAVAGLVTAYAAFMRAHLRLLAVVPKPQAPPRLPDADTYGYGPSRTLPKTLEHAWHLYMDAVTLVHYMAPRLVELLAAGRASTLQGYLVLMSARWAGDACMARATTDLRDHLKPAPGSLLDATLAEMAAAATRVQVLQSAAGNLFVHLTATALNETAEELLLAYGTGSLPPAIAACVKGDAARPTIAFPVVTHKTLEEATHLLNHPQYGVDDELPFTLCSEVGATLSRVRAVVRCARIMRYAAKQLTERPDGSTASVSADAARYLGGLGLLLPPPVTATTVVTVALLAISCACVRDNVTLEMDGEFFSAHDASSGVGAGTGACGGAGAAWARACGGAGGGAGACIGAGGAGAWTEREAVESRRTTIWEQVSGRDALLNEWTLEAGRNRDFCAALASLRAWEVPDWLAVTADEGRANVARATRECARKEAAHFDRIAAEFAALDAASKDRDASKDASVRKEGTGGKGDKEEGKDVPTVMAFDDDVDAHVYAPSSLRSKECAGVLKQLVARAVAHDLEGHHPRNDDKSALAQLMRLLKTDNITSRVLVLNMGVDEAGVPTRYMLDGRELRRLQLEARAEARRKTANARCGSR